MVFCGVNCNVVVSKGRSANNIAADIIIFIRLARCSIGLVRFTRRNDDELSRHVFALIYLINEHSGSRQIYSKFWWMCINQVLKYEYDISRENCVVIISSREIRVLRVDVTKRRRIDWTFQARVVFEQCGARRIGRHRRMFLQRE